MTFTIEELLENFYFKKTTNPNILKTPFKTVILQYIENPTFINTELITNSITLIIKKKDCDFFKFFIENKIIDKLSDKSVLIAKSIYEKSFDILNYLITYRGITFNYLYNGNMALVTYAIKNLLPEQNCLDIFKRSIQDGLNMNTVDSTNNNFLHIALYNNYFNLAKYILTQNNNLKDAKNNKGKLPGDYCVFSSELYDKLPNSGTITNVNLEENNVDLMISPTFPKIKLINFFNQRNVHLPEIRLIEGNSLGSGGFGTTNLITFKNKKRALKSQAICHSKLLEEQCNLITNSIELGEFKYKIIENKIYDYIEYPNIISEIIISGEINKLIKTNCCIHFVETISFFQIKNQFYTIMELLDGRIENLLEFLEVTSLTVDIYINILVQMLYTIYALHTLNISHNDLHYGNILFKKIKSPNLSSEKNTMIDDFLIDGKSTKNIEYFEYNIDGVNIRIKNMGFVLKFIDFGFSTLDIKINNMIHLIRPSKLLSIEGQNFKEFNRNTDLITWLLNFMIFTEEKDKFMLADNITFDNNVKAIADEIKNTVLNNNKEYYNIKVIHRNNKKSLSYNLASYEDIANKLNSYCEPLISYSNNSVIFNILNTFYYNNLNLREYIPIKTFINTLNLKNMLKITNNIFASNYVINNFKCRNNYIINGLQYLNIVKINNVNTITSECCNINGPKLLDTITDNKTYIAINGSFFDIKNTFTPIGLYQDATRKINENVFPIPDNYINYYYVLDISPGSPIKYIKYSDFIKNPIVADNFKNKIIMTVAPLLYDKTTNFSFTNELKTNPSVPDLFDCEDLQGGDKITPNNKYNCSKIAPGELSHGKQKNPRSMLIVDSNDNIILVSCEGRGKRGGGVTFFDMENIAIEFNAKFAFGLDGGRSSHIAIKVPHNSRTIIMNPTYKQFVIDIYPKEKYYPVGNILVFSE